jgi:hypothetical protein
MEDKRLIFEKFMKIKLSYIRLKPFLILLGENATTINLTMKIFESIFSRKNLENWYKQNKEQGINTYLDYVLKQFQKYIPETNIKLRIKPKTSISEFLNFTGKVYVIDQERKLLNILKQVEDKNKEKEEDNELTTYIENLLNGELTFEKGQLLWKAKDGKTKIPYKFLPLRVKSLLPLYLILKNNQIREKDTIIYYYPELGLHPKDQIKLTEILAIMINKGYRVITTTNSPYIVDYLNNLTLGKKSKDLDKIKEFLEYKDLRALIDLDKLGVYTINEEEIENNINKGIISWDTLAKVSDKIIEFSYSI